MTSIRAIFSNNVMELVCDMYIPFQWQSIYGMEKTGFSIRRLLSFYNLIQLVRRSSGIRPNCAEKSNV
jgi:hypothetical protein